MNTVIPGQERAGSSSVSKQFCYIDSSLCGAFTQIMISEIPDSFQAKRLV